MKKTFLSVLAAILIGGTFISCGTEKPNTEADAKQNKDINIKESVTKIETEVGMAMPGDMSEQDLKDVYGMNMDNIEEFQGRNAMVMPGIDVIAIFKAKDGKVDDVKADVQKILEKKKADAYTPILQDAMNQAKIVVNGNYVGLFILQSDPEGTEINSDKAEAIFNGFFK